MQRRSLIDERLNSGKSKKDIGLQRGNPGKRERSSNFMKETPVKESRSEIGAARGRRLSWRIPPRLPGHYVCLEGDLKVYILYKGVTVATSSLESYTLQPRWAKLLKVSSVASEGDMDGMIVKVIMDDIKENGETRFGSRLLLPDCREGTSGKMNYACDEATLRFEPGSQRKATAFGNQPTCRYHH
ncbi:unnamed protein product [Microthlaspi erraticum]|uniref:Uncharacterized protein n=1 Tax=Microthlaspi erraticum TaxID=1685480 RepID=A0A6D2IYX4_9BRAS|nr:unnamed protein product [Microthlaspi erraticum]